MIDVGDIDGADSQQLPEPTTARSLARAGFTVAGTYLIARVLGYVQLLVMGAMFGASDDLDAFFTAFRIPDLIFQLVAAGAIASALVPMIAGLVAKEENARAWRIASTIANLMVIGLLVFAAIGFLAAPALVQLIAPGFHGPKLDRTIELTRLMLLSPMFLGVSSVATAALNGANRFAAAAFAPIIYNLAIIGAAVLLAPSFGVTALAVGVVAGALGHLLVQVPALVQTGFRYVPRIDLRDEQARRALILIGPRVLGLGVTQITFVVMTALASNLQDGSVSAYTIAFALMQIPLGVIGTPLGIVIFPSMARELAIGRTSHYLEILDRSLRIMAFVMLPITALGMVLREQVVALLIGYGKYTAAAEHLTADTLLLFLIGLTAHSAIAVLARAFYARHDTRTPTVAAVLAVVVNCALAIVLVGPLGLPAIGLAIAIAAWSEALLLLLWLHRKEPDIDLGGLMSVVVRCLVAAAAAGIVAFLVLHVVDGFLPNDNLEVIPKKLETAAIAALSTITGGLVYLGVAAALGVSELRTLLSIVVDLGRRRGRA